MSSWTYITASLYVDTFIESDQLKSKIESMLKNAPKITSSNDTEIFVSVPEGYNYAADNLHYTNYQTCAIITVQGCLKDHEASEVRKAWRRFKYFLTHSLNFEIVQSATSIH